MVKACNIKRLNINKPRLEPPMFFHIISIGSLARLIKSTSSFILVTCYSIYASWSSNLIKVDCPLSLSEPVMHEESFSLICIPTSFAYLAGVSLKCYRTKFTDLIESKQMKAWPEGLNGLSVSSSNLFSKRSILSSNKVGFFNWWGMQQLKYASPLEVWAVINICKSFKSNILLSNSSWEAKSGTKWTPSTSPDAGATTLSRIVLS